MIVRLNGRFDAYSQEALRAGFNLVRGPVTIDLQNATLAAAALGEIMALANRIGIQNVELIDPGPLLRKILALTQLDRVLPVRNSRDGRESCRRIA